MPGKSAKPKTANRKRPTAKPRRRRPVQPKANIMRPPRPNNNMKGTIGPSRRNPHRTSVVEAVCSQTNPFCMEAKGAKMFDRSMTPSVPYQIVSTGVLATVGVTGQCALQVTCADGYQGYRTAATFAGSAVATWNARVVPSGAAWLTSNVQRYRVVSFGVRYFSVVSPMNASGLVTVATAGESGSAPDFDSADWVEVNRFPLASVEGQWIGKPRDDDFAMYNNYTSSSTITNYYTTLNLGVAGGPVGGATTVLGFEIIWNLECVLSSGNASVHLSTPAAPHNVTVEQASAGVLSNVPSHIPGPSSNVTAVIMKHATRALDTIMEQAFSYGMRALTL